MNKQTPIAKAIEIAGLRPIARACGLASHNAVACWAKSGRVPLEDPADYAGIIEAATEAEITRADIWAHQIGDLRPGVLYQVPLESIQVDNHQPRQQFDEAALEALAEDLKVSGVQTPISFRRSDSPGAPLTLINGERRYHAAILAGLQTIPGHYDTEAEGADQAERLIRQATDNAQREDLTVWDWACTFKRLNSEYGKTHQQIADEMKRRGIKGFSRPVVSNYCRLHNLPQWAQDLIKIGWLTPAHGKYLLGIKTAGVLSAIGNELRKEAFCKDPAPSVETLEGMIRNTYEKLFPHVDGSPNVISGFPLRLAFNARIQCPTCQHRITTKVTGGTTEHFCTHLPCFDARQAAGVAEKDKLRAETRRQAEADEKKAEATLEGLGAPNEHTHSSAGQDLGKWDKALPGVAVVEDLEGLPTGARVESISPSHPTPEEIEAGFMAQMKRREALGLAIDEAILATEPNKVLALLCWISDDGLDDDGGDTDTLSPDDYLAAIKSDQAATTKNVLRHLIQVLGDDNSKKAARFLGIDPNAIVSRETSEQQKLPI